NDTIERQTALQALAGGQLARFDPTTTFQNPMPDLNAPPTRVPRHPLDGVVDCVHRHSGQQQPLDGLHSRWGLDFHDLYGPQRDCGQALTLTMPGWTQRQGTKPQPQQGLATRLRATPWYLQAEGLRHRLGRHCGPYIAVTACNRNGPGLQSARFLAHITCLYPTPPAHITCL